MSGVTTGAASGVTGITGVGAGGGADDDNVIYPPKADEKILRRSESILKQDFKQFDFIIDQIQLLIELQSALKHDNQPQKIVEIMDIRLNPDDNANKKFKGDGSRASIGDASAALIDLAIKSSGDKSESKSNDVTGGGSGSGGGGKSGGDSNVSASYKFRDVSNPVMPASAYRLYFNALLSLNLCDKFFIEATKFSNKLKQYEFGYTIYLLMIKNGISELSKYLDNRLNRNIHDQSRIFHNPSFSEKDTKIDSDSMYLLQLYNTCMGIVTMVKIHENCIYLPKELNDTIGTYLSLYKNQCHALYKEILKETEKTSANADERKKRAKQYGQLLNDQISKIQTTKSNREYRFREDIEGIVKMMTMLGVIAKGTN